MLGCVAGHTRSHWQKCLALSHSEKQAHFESYFLAPLFGPTFGTERKSPGCISSANSMFVGTNRSATKAALNPKAWVVYAMDTIPLIMNAQGSIQAGERAQIKHDKGRTQPKKHEL